MVKLFSEFRKEMQEDVAGNSAGGGAIAGIGIGAKGEPGVSPKKARPKVLHRNVLSGTVGAQTQREMQESSDDGALTLSIPVFIRSLEIAREIIKSDDELHIFVEKIMDLNVTGPIQMTDIAKVYSQYKD